MITKETIKTEIDHVQEKYLEALYKIIKALESSSHVDLRTMPKTRDFDKAKWHDFIKETYGCLADDPIERGSQGMFETRNEIE